MKALIGLAAPAIAVLTAAGAWTPETGWRGAIEGVLEATVDAMVDLGATREKITAVIGPSISQRNYEVGPELLDAFLSEDDEAGRHFAQGEGDRLLFDLPGFGLKRLRDTPVAAIATIADAEEDPDAPVSDTAKAA